MTQRKSAKDKEIEGQIREININLEDADCKFRIEKGHSDSGYALYFKSTDSKETGHSEIRTGLTPREAYASAFSMKALAREMKCGKQTKSWFNQ